jgi:hypothetical protein
MALKQIAGHVAIKMPRLSGIRTCDYDQRPAQLEIGAMDAELDTLRDGARRQTASRCREQRTARGRTHGTVARDAQAVPAGSPRRLLQVRVRSGRAARGSALPARCPDGYLGRANPDCMRRLRPCGRAIRRDLDRQPTRFGAERAVPKFRAKIAGPPASVYPEIGGCPRADLCAGSEDTDGPVGDPPAMFLETRPRSVRGRIPPGRQARLGQRRR